MIGNVIQTKRKEVGLTQAQLADLLGVSAPAVNKWEKDLCFPDVSLLAPLARLLKIDLNELFSFYSVLSDKEREIIVDEIMMKFFNDGDDVGFVKIDEALKQNPSDGMLLCDIASMLYGMHTLKMKISHDIYLDKIIEYYERAYELVPECSDDIASALMNAYSELGDREKAEHAWSRLKDAKCDKKWTHAEMLYNLKNYSDAVTEMKENILRKGIELFRNLSFFAENLRLSGDEELSALALKKAEDLRALFEIWEGFSAAEKMGVSGDYANGLTEMIEACGKNTEISSCPLFKGVEFGSEHTTADIMSELIQAIKEKQ